MRSFLREEEERSLRSVAERVAQHTQTAGCRAETLGHLLGGKALNAVGAERLVLPLGRIGWFEEDTRKLCKRFVCTVTQNATLLSG